MKFNYRFSNLCGVCHKGGNVEFTPDGNALLSSVGNRVTVFDLVGHTSRTLPFETRKDIKRLTLSHNGRLLVVVDEDGRALLVNFVAQTVLHRFNFKKRVKALAFSPNDRFLAVGLNKHVQVWRTPELRKEFSPLVLHRTYTGHNDTVTSISWSQDGRYFVTGSKDNTTRVYSLDPEEEFVVVTLTGHRERIVGAFMLQEQALPAVRQTDVSLRISDDIVASDPLLSLSQTEPTTVIYTVSADGALIVWRWVWNDLEEEEQVGKKEVDEDDDDEDASSSASSSSSSSSSLISASSISKKRQRSTSKTPALCIKRGEWVRHARYFLQKDNAQVHSVAMHSRRADLVVVGFSNGMFSLFEMPSGTHIQSLSVSQHELKTCAVNCTGEWIALASAQLGQLLVWEWQSETYVLKQQGHFYDLNVVAYSPDGQLLVTGGDDAKLKLWSTTSGFCFCTFSEHSAPVTALSFLGEGNAVVSASLDGTVRAFDLVRYRNFRTMTPPSPVQLTCLATDGEGEVVCAGAMDPGEIYVWSLQTGKLLDVLSGHEGPVASLAFSPSGATLASCSWDQTLRLWKPYDSTAPQETLSVYSDALCVAWRPDGGEVCVAALNGNLQLWNPESGNMTGVIEGAKDVSGGRRAGDRVTAKAATHNKHFSSVCYTADGRCVIAGGRSKFVCIFQVEQKVLLKKYQLSHNRSLNGVLDKLDSRLTSGEAGPAAFLDVSDAEDSDEDYAREASALPGAARGIFGKRITPPEIRCKSVRFSPTGQEWAAATTEGLMIFALDSGLLFDPFMLDEDTTPQKIRELAGGTVAVAATTTRAGLPGIRNLTLQPEYGRALTLALHLGEKDLVTEVYRAIPREAVQLVARNVPIVYLQKVFDMVASELTKTPQVENHLSWALALLTAHNDRLRSQAPTFLSSFRGLQKAVNKHAKDLSKLCNQNMYQLAFLANAAEKQKTKASNTVDNLSVEVKPQGIFKLVNPAVDDDAVRTSKKVKL